MADKKFTIKITDNETGKVKCEIDTDCYFCSCLHEHKESTFHSIGVSATTGDVIQLLLSLPDLESEVIQDFSEEEMSAYSSMRMGKMLLKMMENINNDETDDEQAILPKNLC